MKKFAAALIVLSMSFVSCGKLKNSKKDDVTQRPGAEARPCGGFTESLDLNIFCLPQPKWTITINRSDIPSNMLLSIDGHDVLNECSGDAREFRVNRDTSTEITAERFIMPAANRTFDVVIIDLGSNCLGDKIYYRNEKQDFTMEEIDKKYFVDIVLD